MSNLTAVDEPTELKTKGTSDVPVVENFEDLTFKLAALAESESGARFFRRALALVQSYFSAPYAALDVAAADQHVRIEEGGQGARGEFWRENLQNFLSETLADSVRARYRMLESKSHDFRAALLSAPLFDQHGRRSGCLVTATQVNDREEARFRLSQLERVAIFLTLFQGTAVESAAATATTQQASAGVLARVSGYRSRIELAFAVTNGLRGRTDCDLVALGVVENRRIRLLSISGADDVKSRCPGVLAMTAAMEEASDAARAVVWPQTPEWIDQDLPRNYRLHQRWSEIAGAASVATIPLLSEAGCVAVLAMRKASGSGFSPEQIAGIAQTCSGYAAALDLVHRAGRSIFRHVGDSATRSVREFLAPRGFGAKLFPILVMTMIAWLTFGQLSYHVSGKARLEQSDLARVGVPQDGRLHEILVRPGDSVVAGQVLCRFETRDFELEARRLESDVAIAGIDLDRALAEGNAAEAAMAQAKRRSLEASLDLVRHRIEAASVRAPMAGIVLDGDLRDRLGDVMGQGSPLFEIAGADGWRLVVEIDEGDLALFPKLPTGDFSPRARPEDSRSIKVTAIRPRAEQHDQKNVFIADASIGVVDSWMRHGMEGVVSLDAGRRPVWWIAGRRALNWLEMNFWL